MGQEKSDTGLRRLCVSVLYAVPFVAAGLAARPMRIEGAHQAIGVACFIPTLGAGVLMGARAWRSQSERGRLCAMSGLLLIIPFSLVLLLWTGLGTPWEASPSENRMRYVVLLISSVAATGGLAGLRELAVSEGDRAWSTLGGVTATLAGAAYIVWFSIHVGAWSTVVRTGELPSAMVSLNDPLDTLLFAACALTYLATAVIAVSLVRVRRLSRSGGYVLAFVCFAALVLLSVRGLSFPNPTATSTPWYTRPGFIAGIPAIPWVIPHLLGVAVLTRAAAEGRGAAID